MIGAYQQGAVQRAPPARARSLCRSKQLVWAWTLLARAQESRSFALSSSSSFSSHPPYARHRPPIKVRRSVSRPSSFLRCGYLSDLPTPALLVDVDAATATNYGDSTKDPPADSNSDFPRLQVRSSSSSGQGLLVPVTESSSAAKVEMQARPPQILLEEGSQQGGDSRQLFFLHARVIRGRDVRRRLSGSNVDDDDDDDAVAPTLFLCELDLPGAYRMASEPEEEAAGPIAQLVLGLNNHHVGSYYWARSAGAGAAMEAPGVELREGNVLRWKSSDFETCNSNDGKRSEWVNFLRPGDQVQLAPLPCAVAALIEYYAKQDRVYGVSARGRPLGSEPLVVCRYQLRNVAG